MLRRFLFVMPFITPSVLSAATPPLAPPCGQAPSPAYPPVGQPPAVELWNEADLRRLDWRPPACLGWEHVRTRLVAALAGQFVSADSLDVQSARLADPTALTGIRYWSTSGGVWKPLASEAGMLTGPEGEPRQRMLPSELTTGSVAYYFEVGRAGRTVHRLSVLERLPDRMSLATENVAPVRIGLLTVFEPGALQTVKMLERRGPDLWGYYQVIRATEGASAIALGKDASYVNRLVALYRFAAGIPTDREPPAAR